MKIKNKFKKINLLFFVILLIFLLYSFDYSLGWGMNLMLPEIYLFTNGTGNSGYHPFIWNESGFIENIQALILFLTILQLIFLFFLKKNVSLLLRYFMILNIVGISYIFFEEISWGQHFFNYKSPEIFLNKNSLFYNRQGEFNLHNISNMFNEILKEFEKNIVDTNISKLIYYFERHIELDEDEHGPMALEMISELAQNDSRKWEEIEKISIEALKKRILLWDAIDDQLENKSWSNQRGLNNETYSLNYNT